MSPDLERLIELQQLATAMTEARREIDTHPGRLQAADDVLNGAIGAVDSATAALEDNKQRRRDLEKKASIFQGRLTKFQEQLSSVKTNREYQAIQTEIASAKEELGAAEERILEGMVETDGLTARLAEAEAALAVQRKEVAAEKQVLATELAATETALATATQAHESLLKELPSRITALFDKVANIRKGVALSLATIDGLCSKCHVRLRPMVFQEVRQNDAIVQCDSCRRILYYVPPPPVPPTEQAAAPA
jgi:predicted  nucleic acid-binding Zn-ribbon protein